MGGQGTRDEFVAKAITLASATACEKGPGGGEG
jgi:hypothetical protein